MDKNSNYFGRSLERLLLTSGIKNYTIAVALNYDVSYISKWISGKMLPSRKNAERICAMIAEIVCSQVSENNRQILEKEYGVKEPERLRDAVAETLIDSFYEAAGISAREQFVNNSVLRVHPEGCVHLLTDFFQEMERKKPMKAAVITDLFSLDHSTKLLVAGIEKQRFKLQELREDVQLHVIIDIQSLSGSNIYDVILLIHLLTHYSLTDFHLSYSTAAAGRLIVAVSGEYSGVSLLSEHRQFLCTSVTRDAKMSRALYDSILMECNPDRQLFFHTAMEDLLLSHEYLRSLLSRENKWLAGHITEHFISSELFAKLAEKIWPKDPQMQTEAKKAHQLVLRTAEKNGLNLMIYDTALTNFILSGEVDFFNHKIILSQEERKDQLEYMYSMLRETENMQVKMIRGGFSDDFKYITNPCMFLSDAVDYLRLENNSYKNNVLLIKDKSVQDIFHTFFDEIWTQRPDVVLSDRQTLQTKLLDLMESADLLSSV